jgi:hypothetical protein
MLADSRVTLERWLDAHVARGAVVETVGNPHYLPRITRTRAVVRVNHAMLSSAPRAPLGSAVVMTSLDRLARELHSDPTLRQAYWEPLAREIDSGVARTVEFPAPPLAELYPGLPVGPAFTVVLRDTASATGRTSEITIEDR